MKKRDFIKNMGALAIGPWASTMMEAPRKLGTLLPKALDDTALWEMVRSHYRLKPDYINLESGYYNIIPQPTLDSYMEHVRHINYEGSYYMRTVRVADKNRVAAALAELVGASAEEVIVTRNTTESLDTVIGGFPWKEGDEAVYALQDYGAMRVMFEQVAEKYGVVTREVSVPNHPQSDEEIVDLYASQITPQTRLLMVCHMINITGQILPIRKICDMAHARGVEVMVDGAHCVGHFDFSMADLDCDYYGSSLHKWLATPLGAGLLYVRKDKIDKIWPRFADYEKDKSQISRLNHTGTHPSHTDLAILNAIEYLNWMGLSRKEARLRALKNYWLDQLTGVPGVVINTPRESARSCGIGNVGLERVPAREMASRLLDEHGVFTVGIEYANVNGCRITPNVFTTFDELDRFVDAVKEMA